MKNTSTSAPARSLLRLFLPSVFGVFWLLQNAGAQVEVTSGQVKGAEFVYELGDTLEAMDQSAQGWNEHFQDLGTNVKAFTESGVQYPVILMANCLPNETEMQVVMTFNFSGSGHMATGVAGGHWMQSFADSLGQPYYQRFYSVNGEKEVLIDQSPSWGEFPNEGDSKATGFSRMLYMGGETDDMLVFPKPAKTFTYRIVVKFQDRKAGDPVTVPVKLVQPIRGTTDPSLKRAPMVLTFSMAPAK